MPNDALPEVAGFVVTGWAERSDSADYVAAIDAGSRERVLLRLLPRLDDAEREAIRSSLEQVATVVDDHLDRPARLASEADVLVMPARAWALDTLPARPSVPGQVVTVVVPVAQAVAALHSGGLAHGSVCPETINVDDDGRPWLGEAGVAAALHVLAPREVPAPTPEKDADDLLRLLQGLADGVGDAAFTALVAGLVDSRAEPAAVADRLLSEVTPVALGDAVVDDEVLPGGDSGTSRRRWPWLVVALVLAAVVAGVAAVLSTARDDPATSTVSTPIATPTPTRTAAIPVPEPMASTTTAAPSPGSSPTAVPAGTLLCGAPEPGPQTPPPLADDWAEVVRALYVRRSAALVTGQTALLCDVYDPRSPGLASDLELDAAYVEQGVRPDALVFVVEEASLASQEGSLLTVEITDRLEPYRLVDDTGRAVAELPGVPAETWQARLVPNAAGTEWVFG